MTDRPPHEPRAGDDADIARWLTANMVFGAIVGVGLVAMALTSSADSGGARRAHATASTAEAMSAAPIVVESR
jgi:hypothetical protein